MPSSFATWQSVIASSEGQITCLKKVYIYKCLHEPWELRGPKEGLQESYWVLLKSDIIVTTQKPERIPG